MIEFTHRITSGLSFFAVVGCGVDLPGHGARTPGARGSGDLGGTHCVEAILGALLVKLGYTAQKPSAAPPCFFGAAPDHTLLLAALTLTAHLLSRRKGYLRGCIRPVSPFGALGSALVC